MSPNATVQQTTLSPSNPTALLPVVPILAQTSPQHLVVLLTLAHRLTAMWYADCPDQYEVGFTEAGPVWPFEGVVATVGSLRGSIGGSIGGSVRGIGDLIRYLSRLGFLEEVEVEVLGCVTVLVDGQF